MSYIAYDVEAMNVVPAIATATGAPVGSIGWGLPQMWLWCIRNEQSIITDRHLQGFFGRIDDLGNVLMTFGFLEPVEGGWLVRGAERHLQRVQAKRESGRSSRERQLSEGGKRPSKSASGAGAGVTPGSPQGNPRMTPGRPQSVPGVTQGQPRDNPGVNPGKTPKNGPDPGQKRGLTPNTYLSPEGEREIGGGLESSARARKPGPPPHGGQAAPAMEPPAKSYEQLVAEWDPCGLEPDPRHDWDGPIDGCGTKGHRPYKRATRHPDGVIQYHTCPQCAADSFERVRKAQEAQEAKARSEARWDRRAQMPQVPRPPDDAPEDEHMAWAIQQSAWLRWVETGEDKPAEDRAGVAA